MISESVLLQQRACVSEWEDNILFDVDDPDFAGSIAQSVATGGGNNNRQQSAAVLSAMIMQKVPSTMSLADMQKPSYLSMSALSIHSSLSDLAASSSPFDQSLADNNAVLTIEELRAHMGSCFTCGVSWTDDHVSLDCSECGGYSSQRPCPLCDGACGELWKRDFSMSHACSKARWIGHCPTHSSVTDSPLFTVLPPAVAAAVVQHRQNAAAAAAAAAASAASVASASAAASSCASSVASATSQQPNQQQSCGASQFLAHDLCVRLERLSASAQT